MMFIGVVAFLLSAVAAVNAQDVDAPVFRADANALSFEFGASSKRGPRGKAAPFTTLTSDDLKVVIDGKAYAPTTMTQDRPGHYVLSLDIPDRYRDGKTHKVRFKVKQFTFPYTHTFKLPDLGEAAAPSAH